MLWGAPGWILSSEFLTSFAVRAKLLFKKSAAAQGA
jgi:hypothetical protein